MPLYSSILRIMVLDALMADPWMPPNPPSNRTYRKNKKRNKRFGFRNKR